MSPAGFDPAIPASERPQIHALGRAAIGIRTSMHTVENFEKVYDFKTYLPLNTPLSLLTALVDAQHYYGHYFTVYFIIVKALLCTTGSCRYNKSDNQSRMVDNG
jgi:hypothetical protein